MLTPVSTGAEARRVVVVGTRAADRVDEVSQQLMQTIGENRPGLTFELVVIKEETRLLTEMEKWINDQPVAVVAGRKIRYWEYPWPGQMDLARSRTGKLMTLALEVYGIPLLEYELPQRIDAHGIGDEEAIPGTVGLLATALLELI